MDFRLESGRLPSAAAVRVSSTHMRRIGSLARLARRAIETRASAVFWRCTYSEFGVRVVRAATSGAAPIPASSASSLLLYGLACASRKRCSRPLCWLSPCQKSFRRISAARHVAGSDLPLSRGANSAIEPVTGSAAAPQRTAVMANGRIGTAPPSTARHKTAAALATGNRSSLELTPREEKL